MIEHHALEKKYNELVTIFKELNAMLDSVNLLSTDDLYTALRRGYKYTAKAIHIIESTDKK